MSNATIVSMEITSERMMSGPTEMSLEVREDRGFTTTLYGLPFRPVHLGERVTLTLDFEEATDE